MILLPDEKESWLKVDRSTGCFYYFGITGYGKTYLALEHLKQMIERDGRPSLILDCMPDKYNLNGLEHVQDPDSLLRLVYHDGRHGIYTPKAREEIAYIVRGMRGGKRIHFLWDEPAVHFPNRELPNEVGAFVRGWRQSDCGTGHSVQVVSQCPADLSDRSWWITYPEVYTFFLERTADQERLRDELKIPIEAVAALEGRKRRPITRKPEGEAA